MVPCMELNGSTMTTDEELRDGVLAVHLVIRSRRL